MDGRIKNYDINTREYDIEYLRLLIEFKRTGRPLSFNIPYDQKKHTTRYIIPAERIAIDVEIARLRNKLNLKANEMIKTVTLEVTVDVVCDVEKGQKQTRYQQGLSDTLNIQQVLIGATDVTAALTSEHFDIIERQILDEL